MLKLNKNFVRNICKKALNEDLYPDGDITSELIDRKIKKKIKLISNQNGIIAGLDFAKETFGLIDKQIKFSAKKKEGSVVKKNEVIATIQGRVQNILIGERVALNFLSHISGIATKTNLFVKKVGKKTKICCTRKTIPTLRYVQKYAVKVGGGLNHRFNLSDEFLIKDNHVAISDIKALILKAIKNKKNRKITVEVDNLNQLKKIIGLKFNTVLLDNMNTTSLKKAVKLAKKYYKTEASGNIHLKNVKDIAQTGVNRISIGSLTHSSSALDLKLEI